MSGMRAYIQELSGGKLAAAAHGLVTSLGVDSIESVTCTGWSVTVTGPARLIGDEPVTLPGTTAAPGRASTSRRGARGPLAGPGQGRARPVLPHEEL